MVILFCRFLVFCFFFFKQKTAYEMRISDWSSDVCSSDLLHMVTAGSGGWFTFLRWVNFLMGTRTAGDLLTADRNAAKELPAMQKAAGEPGEAIIVTAGWSEAHGRAIGAVYHSLSGFASQLLTEPGHTTMPEVNPGGTDYLDLAARWSPAAMGEETEAFHVALAKNFYESYEWGRLRPGVGIGGQLITARIDRDGIAVRRTYDFPPLRGR